MLLSIVALPLAPRAAAAPQPLGAGGADWGLKKSLVEYAEEGGPAGITLSGGVTRNQDGSFHLPVAGGSFDPATGATLANFAGVIQLSGDGGQLDLRISGLAAEITADGGALFADVVNGSASYSHLKLAALETNWTEPVVAGGTTTWPPLPATLTRGGEAGFDKLLTAGAGLDPFVLSYQGAGGKPLPEPFDPQGVPGYSAYGYAQTPSPAAAMFIDDERGVLHMASPAGVTARGLYGLGEWGSIASPVPLSPSSSGYAFDQGHGTTFAVPDATVPAPIRAFTWDPSLSTYTEETLGIDAVSSTRLAYVESTETLFAIDGSGYPGLPFNSTFRPAVAVAKRQQGGGWTTPSYPPLPLEGRAVSDLALTSKGVLVATAFPYYEGSPPAVTSTPNPAMQLIDTGSQLEAVPINYTEPPVPSSGYTLGYLQAFPGPNGMLALAESSPPAPTAYAEILSASPGSVSPSYAFELGPQTSGFALDDANGTAFALQPSLGQVTVFRNGNRVRQLRTVPPNATAFEPSLAVARENRLYVQNDSPPWIYYFDGSSETSKIALDPEDALATLPGPNASAPVSFTAGATGNPPPAIRWQSRPPGSAVWSDVPGAEVNTLKVTATAALAGYRYRAVFKNNAGEVQTRSGTLAVGILAAAAGGGGGDGSAAGDQAGAGTSAPIPRIVRPPGSKPGLRVARGAALVVRYNGVATLARVACRPPWPCALTAPRRLKLRIGGEDFAAKVLAPTALAPDRTRAVLIQLPPRARKAIARRKATATLRLALSSAGQRLERTVTVTLRGRDA